MAPHSSTLAWKISRTEEPGRLQSMGVAISFSRGIFLIQGWNPGLPHCRQTLLPSEPTGKSTEGLDLEKTMRKDA